MSTCWVFKHTFFNIVLFLGVRRELKDGKKEMYDLEKKINDAVFPGLQGGPHNHQIGGRVLLMLQA